MKTGCAAGLRGRPAAFRARHHLVAQADVGERAAHHHLVIAATRAVRVEVLPLHAVLEQPFAGGTRRRNVARRRDVVGRDRIAEHRRAARARDRLHARRLHRHAVEVRRVLHVRGIVLPRVRLAGRHVEPLPVLVALEDVGVLRLEELLLHAAENLVLHFLRRRPDVAQEHRAVAADAERLAREVDVHAAGERVRDDQRRRREIVEARERIDAPLEVAVARQHARDEQLSPARWPRRSARAADPSCRCTSCSRSRRD